MEKILPKCSNCEGTSVIKRGFSKSNQRYGCKNCKQIFTLNNRTYSKKLKADVIKFLPIYIRRLHKKRKEESKNRFGDHNRYLTRRGYIRYRIGKSRFFNVKYLYEEMKQGFAAEKRKFVRNERSFRRIYDIYLDKNKYT